MGLHRHTPELLDRARELVAEDGRSCRWSTAVELLLVLHVSREPLEAHHLAGVIEVAGAAYDRACYLHPRLVATADQEEAQTRWTPSIRSFRRCRRWAIRPERQDLRQAQLELRWHRPPAATPAVFAGRGVRPSLRRRPACPIAISLSSSSGHLVSPADQGRGGPRFLRGLLSSARNVLWQVPEAIRQSSTRSCADWDEEHFVRQLPHLRLAFADLTPRECDQVARLVAGLRRARPQLKLITSSEYSSADLIRGADVNRRVMEGLKRDGLEDFGG